MIDAPRTAGIYFLWDKDDEVIYVGSAKNLHRRILQSHAERGSVAYSFIEEPDDDKRYALERTYIQICVPKLNTTYKDRSFGAPVYPCLKKYSFEDNQENPKGPKILLRIDPDIQAALQKEARKIAAEEDRNYSLTELINDILKKHLQR